MNTDITENSMWGFGREDLLKKINQKGFPSVHLKLLFQALYRSPFENWSAYPSLPKKIGSLFENQEKSEKSLPAKVRSSHVSKYDQSVKLVVELKDGQQVETVIMPESNRITLCISSQVGCAQACIFCHTGRMGLKRDLSASEIVSQVLLANRFIGLNADWFRKLRLNDSQKRVSNIVFMGMGEPLDNVDSVSKAIEILQDPWGLGIAPKRITVSTAGHLEGFQKMISLHPKVSFALSLHNPDDSKRRKLMPITKQFPLEDLMCFMRSHFREKKSCMIQYTVIRNVNDSLDDAKRLVELLSGINCKVNLIPLNPIDVNRLQSPDQKNLLEFRDFLHHKGVRVLVRYSKGQDIGAACGQLVK